MTRLRWVQLAAGIAIFSVLLAQIDLEGARDALRDAEPLALVAVVLLNIPLIALFGLRSDLVLRRLGHALPLALVMQIALVGNVAGALTPASTGELLRVAALRSNANVPPDDSLALVFFERGLSLYLLALSSLAGLAWLTLPLAPAAAATAGCIAALALPLLAPAVLRRIGADSEPDARGWRSGLRRIASQLAALLGDTRLLTRWGAMTLSVFGVISLQYWLLARSISPSVSLLEAFVTLGLSQLIAIISLIPLGIGAADGSIAALLRRFGMTLEQGTAVALLARATSTLPLVAAALGCYIWLMRRAPTGADTATVVSRRSA